MAVAQLSNFSGVYEIAVAVGTVMLVLVVGFLLTASRRVYQEGWVKVVAKTAGAGSIYFVLFLAGFIAALAWLVRFQ